jgi:hypothetical protein
VPVRLEVVLTSVKEQEDRPTLRRSFALGSKHTHLALAQVVILNRADCERGRSSLHRWRLATLGIPWQVLDRNLIQRGLVVNFGVLWEQPGQQFWVNGLVFRHAAREDDCKNQLERVH